MADEKIELPTLLDPALDIARQAGRRILEIYEGGFSVDLKSDSSPLTEADMAAHHLIDAGLRELVPDLPVLSEESAHIPFAERRHWRRYWLVDPLDGTREFINRNGEFTVNIALIEDGVPVAGVVHAPVLDVSYVACRDGGSYKHSASDRPRRIQARAWNGEGMLVVAGSRSHRGASLERFLAKVGDHELVSMGSSLKLCLVAEGKVDVYPRLGPTSEWDTAAAQCVVESAGGHLTDTAMQRLRYNKESLLNPHFFAFGATRTDWSRYL